jgi:hypothetical protein
MPFNSKIGLRSSFIWLHLSKNEQPHENITRLLYIIKYVYGVKPAAVQALA